MATAVLAPTDAIIPIEKEVITEKASVDSSSRKLGPYIIKETLGEGGFSKVKLGVHEKSGEKVALKILKNKLTKTVRKQVEREINAMTKLDHPNVLKMKHVDWECPYTKKSGKKVNVILVVLELATGGELFEFLSFTGFFEEAIARTYFHQLIAGVEYCHSKGVAHRDLKPENLLLDEEFTLKLADFGFSNVVSASKLMTTECGTPGYMAPEMLNLKASKAAGYDAMKVDIWAIGVILFIMLAGFPPFQKPSPSDWWFNKLTTNKHALFWQAHSRTAYFSEQTKDFINKILNPNPEKRISLAEMKKHPWWKGPTITYAALVAELNRRKNTVDRVKTQEKERKKKERVGDAEVTRGEGDDVVIIGDKEKTRGLDDDLPTSPPMLTFKHEVFLTPARMEITDTPTFSLEDALEEKEEKDPEPYDSTVARYTNFRSEASPSSIIQRLREVITLLNGKLAASPGYKLRVEFTDASFFVQVFSDPKNSKQYVVDFRRKMGQAMFFRSRYQEIRSRLSDVILQPKTDSVKTDSAKADTVTTDSEAMTTST